MLDFLVVILSIVVLVAVMRPRTYLYRLQERYGSFAWQQAACMLLAVWLSGLFFAFAMQDLLRLLTISNEEGFLVMVAWLLVQTWPLQRSSDVSLAVSVVLVLMPLLWRSPVLLVLFASVLSCQVLLLTGWLIMVVLSLVCAYLAWCMRRMAMLR